ncbi:MAG: amidohydrolase family protein [Chitinispirillaceae bacterium]
MNTTVYFAKHIYLENGDILQNGAVSVQNGRIYDVGPRGKLKRCRDERIVNLGDMLVLPGFINMHTHLEEGAIRGFEKSAEETFASWSNKRMSRMRQLTPERIEQSIRLCARELVAQGTTTVVDSSRTGLSVAVLQSEPIRALMIKEIADEDQQEKSFGWAKENVGKKGVIGIGPHALFSLCPKDQRRIIEFTYENRCVWACHMGESAEELQAFSEQDGDLYFHLTRRKVWPFGEAKLGPMHYAITENLIPSNGVLFHCNYINGHELSLLAAKKVHIVLCTKYGKMLGHKGFPVDVARNRGVQICLGTEGSLPAGEMNLFDELFHLKTAYPHISASEMIGWVTKNPAAAIGMSDKLGSIRPGKHADLIGVRFPHDPEEDILESMFEADPDIGFVLIGGEEIIIDR